MSQKLYKATYYLPDTDYSIIPHIIVPAPGLLDAIQDAHAIIADRYPGYKVAKVVPV
jgi:hypothetical protein|tara:strand:+ start:379 stop:549 length:171 start_codon:yes stop_codon:yes gene_type:complete